jgi:hypothetical protein
MQNDPNTVLAYRISDAVRVSSIGRSRLYELIAEGRVKAVRCGGRTLICARSLRDFIEGLPSAEIGRRGRPAPAEAPAAAE